MEAPSLSCDPIPPLTRVTEYDATFFAGSEDVFAFRPRTRREREADGRMLAQMIPDAAIRQELQVRLSSSNFQLPGSSTNYSQYLPRLFMTRVLISKKGFLEESYSSPALLRRCLKFWQV